MFFNILSEYVFSVGSNLKTVYIIGSNCQFQLLYFRLHVLTIYTFLKFLLFGTLSIQIANLVGYVAGPAGIKLLISRMTEKEGTYNMLWFLITWLVATMSIMYYDLNDYRKDSPMDFCTVFFMPQFHPHQVTISTH